MDLQSFMTCWPNIYSQSHLRWTWVKYLSILSEGRIRRNSLQLLSVSWASVTLEKMIWLLLGQF
nr:hypothetical protein Iba_chr04aCG23680 [Ipomoea batatas]GMC83189.1 hypothetical protein Iba_chr04bCG20500 [Ipomoea batatas]GMC85166.1 hypothetical protein Iba_chr04cCG18590 [Ipomoea batatas]GMC87369.1 hypothetical protein Iba_chr04dCG19500 [Ipomoea batatas]